MTLQVGMYVPEGIVFASDSQITYSFTSQNGTNRSVFERSTHSDSRNKLFLAPNHIGISVRGVTTIEGASINHQMQDFLRELGAGDRAYEVDEVAEKLHEHFGKLASSDTSFYVFGYKSNGLKREKYIYDINLMRGTCERWDTRGYGCVWGGDIDIASRLLKSNVKCPAGGASWTDSEVVIPYGELSLQDAVDLAVTVIRTSSLFTKLQSGHTSVGGDVDVLVVRPDEGAEWVQRKSLHIKESNAIVV